MGEFEKMFIDRAAKDRALVAAVLKWVQNCEGRPSSPSDAKLLKAIWRYEGDRTEACPDCDGDCGEPCAPTTAEAACRGLDNWIADYKKRQGFAP